MKRNNDNNNYLLFSHPVRYTALRRFNEKLQTTFVFIYMYLLNKLPNNPYAIAKLPTVSVVSGYGRFVDSKSNMSDKAFVKTNTRQACDCFKAMAKQKKSQLVPKAMTLN